MEKHMTDKIITALVTNITWFDISDGDPKDDSLVFITLNDCDIPESARFYQGKFYTCDNCGMFIEKSSIDRFAYIPEF